MESCCAVVRPVDWRIRGRQFWMCNVQAAGAMWLDAQIFIYGNDGVFMIKKRGMYSTGRLHNPNDFCHKLKKVKCTDGQNKITRFNSSIRGDNAGRTWASCFRRHWRR